MSAKEVLEALHKAQLTGADLDPEHERVYRRLNEAAILVFNSISKYWGLTEDERRLLIGTTVEDMRAWMADPRSAGVSIESLERISHLLAIFVAINTLLPRREAADAWMRRPNSAFGGNTALSVMLTNGLGGITEVRGYLEGQIGR